MSKNLLIKNYIPVIIVGILCFTKFAGLNILLSIIYLFIENKNNKGKSEDIGFKPKNILVDIKEYWWLIFLPIVSGIVAIGLSKLILPDFYLHVLNRTKPMLSLDKIFILIPQLFILAFGEEIAFRAFFQTKIRNITNPIWSVLITSLFFAIGHYSPGSISVIIYDLFFVFIDSVIYGIIYLKTKNVYSCTISHFSANLVGIFILMLF